MKRLKELRESQGLTTTELGDILGCSNPTITHYEHGDRQPTPEMVKKIANYFNVSIDYLLENTTEEEYNAGTINSTTQKLNADQFAWLEIYDGLVEKYGQDFAKNMINLVDNFLNK